MVDLVNVLLDAIAQVLQDGHDQGYCAHRVDLVGKKLTVVEDLLDESEHHVQRGTLALEVGRLKHFGCLNHEVNQRY